MEIQDYHVEIDMERGFILGLAFSASESQLAF
ncbi:hypothetical protein HNR39_003066 [Glaciimonas immobilis]|uniref:Uncharacterized protein n=1 Tax=Glaciimonas immobilis TaxID=728004 RepID=A0A840RRW0_9BURK|nr:hypothetical protein [Glaciimonas immobilis]